MRAQKPWAAQCTSGCRLKSRSGGPDLGSFSTKVIHENEANCSSGEHKMVELCFALSSSILSYQSKNSFTVTHLWALLASGNSSKCWTKLGHTDTIEKWFREHLDRSSLSQNTARSWTLLSGQEEQVHSNQKVILYFWNNSFHSVTKQICALEEDSGIKWSRLKGS